RDREYHYDMLSTDAAGAFRFGPLPAGSYEVAAFAKGLSWILADRIELKPGEERTVEPLRYAPGGTLRAVLLGEDGAALATADNAHVTASTGQVGAPLPPGPKPEAPLPPGEA